MKKKLFLGLLAAAAVSFTACQKDEVLNEVQQDNAIGFGTYVGRDAQTKADEATDNTLKEDGFGVFAYYTGANNYASTTAPEFMYNQQVSYTTEWNYSPSKYWPGNSDQYKVSFFAYAPYTNVTSNPNTNITEFGTTGTDVGDPTLTFKVAGTVSQQVDLLYAAPVKDRWNGDSQTPADQKVKFTFNHALSRIGFKVRTNREDYRVKISQIILSGNFNTTGTLNLNTGLWQVTTDTDTDNYELNFTYEDSDNPNDYITDITTGTGTGITADEGYLMIIPTTFVDNVGDLNDNILKITVTYKYQYNVFGTTWADAVQDTKTGEFTPVFEKGKAYNIVMTLDPLSPIEFNVTRVEGWDPATGTDTPVTVTTPPVNN